MWWVKVATAFYPSRIPLYCNGQIYVSADPHEGRMSVYGFWVLSSPHPPSSSLAPHPDQPEFTPIQDELEALELWGSGIWLPREELEDQLQEHFRDLIRAECPYVVCILPFRAKCHHQPKSLPWILFLLTKKVYLKSPLNLGHHRLIFFVVLMTCQIICLFVLQRRVLREKLAKKKLNLEFLLC